MSLVDDGLFIRVSGLIQRHLGSDRITAEIWLAGALAGLCGLLALCGVLMLWNRRWWGALLLLPGLLLGPALLFVS